jgi:EAL domain-containing protein (putative c-di-GMP-specific phosphodiesterase class I)
MSEQYQDVMPRRPDAFGQDSETLRCCKGRVLLVDDEPAILGAYLRVLGDGGYSVEAASTAVAARELLSRCEFDVVVSDLWLEDQSGIELLRYAKERLPDLPVVLVSAAAELDNALRAIEHGAHRFLLKPVEPAALCATVERAVQLAKMARLQRQAFERYGRDAHQRAARQELGEQFDGALTTLHMHYQPIVSWSARAVIGHEALVRNDEPALRRPDQLLAAAEQLERLWDMGRAIRRRVAHDVASVSTPTFVNLHPFDLGDPDLYDPGAPLSVLASRIVLELTERAALDEIEDLAGRLTTLRRMGFRLALDDLGAGYAGLGAMLRLQPDIVKFDMSLTRGIDSDHAKQKLVRRMGDLCAELGMRVVIEGVETPAERDILAIIGCDQLQGYLFARPGRPFPEVSF